eukprot:7851052-Pyramimonas_sp.AAC.1
MGTSIGQAAMRSVASWRNLAAYRFASPRWQPPRSLPSARPSGIRSSRGTDASRRRARRATTATSSWSSRTRAVRRGKTAPFG